jgi:hypothetical protein
MSSNYASLDRSMYDEASYEIQVKQSSKPLGYMLNTGAHENCKECGEKPNVTNHMERVDLESDLLGHNRKLSNDPIKQYQKNDKIANTLNYVPPFLCERNLTNNKFYSTDNNNDYMEKLRNLDPKDMNNIDSTSQNMCVIKDYLNN